MITADPNSKLGHYCKIVAELMPGQCVDFEVVELSDIASFEHKGGNFTPPDRICENIVGSMFTVSYYLHPHGRTVTFEKHEDTGNVRYTSPDRRDPGRL